MMSTPLPIIRKESSRDIAAIRRVNETAFGRDDEANLIDALRVEGANILSLVAEANGEIIGHILFCRVQIQTPNGVLPAVSLSPMAVLPEHQNRGVGSQLVRRGLEVLRAQGESVVTVLGHPKFYPRFGFRPAHEFNIACPYEVPPEAWVLLELESGVLAGRSGIVVYPRAFAELEE